MKHISNIISGIRLLLIGVFIFFFTQAKYLNCIIVYIAAFISDLLDGYLARRNGWISDLGKILDPLADKLMLLTAITCFFIKGWMPLYMFVIIMAKELIMLIGGFFMLRRGVVVYADWFGKFAAGFFTASVVATLLMNFSAFRIIGELNLNLILFGIAIACAIVALVHYARVQVFNRPRQSGD